MVMMLDKQMEKVMKNSMNTMIATALAAAMLLSAPISASAFVSTEGQADHWINPTTVTSTGSVSSFSGSGSSHVYTEGQQRQPGGGRAITGARSNPVGSPIAGAGSYGHSYGEGQQKEPPALPAR